MFEKNEPLVSILIAAYNEEKYIGRCIESVQTQTYKNIEIVIVNDGSTDKTEDICKTYAEKDNRIKIIKQKNLGLPLARKKGLEAASGQFIQFIDGDDWCEKERTERMVDTILKDSSDIVFSSAYRHRDDGVAVICNLPIDEGSYTIDDIKLNYIEPLFGDLSKDKLVITGYVWCCLYRREILDNIVFYKDIILHEDEILNLQALMHSSNISVIKDSLYNYNRRINTLSKKNKYWDGYWENMVSVYWAKKKIGSEFFEGNRGYLERLSTSIYQKYLRSVRNETHYTNPAHFWGGLKNLYLMKAEDVLSEANEYYQADEFSSTEKFLISCIQKRLYFIPYLYYAMKTDRMRNFQEKTKN